MIFFLEIYTLGTYSDVMSNIVREPQKYVRYMSSEQRGFRKLNILLETEIVAKQCSDDSDEQLKDQ